MENVYPDARSIQCVNKVRCEALMKSGKRKGEQCNAYTDNLETKLCKKHKTYTGKRGEKKMGEIDIPTVNERIPTDDEEEELERRIEETEKEIEKEMKEKTFSIPSPREANETFFHILDEMDDENLIEDELEIVNEREIEEELQKDTFAPVVAQCDIDEHSVRHSVRFEEPRPPTPPVRHETRHEEPTVRRYEPTRTPTHPIRHEEHSVRQQEHLVRQQEHLVRQQEHSVRREEQRPPMPKHGLIDGSALTKFKAMKIPKKYKTELVEDPDDPENIIEKLVDDDEDYEERQEYSKINQYAICSAAEMVYHYGISKYADYTSTYTDRFYKIDEVLKMNKEMSMQFKNAMAELCEDLGIPLYAAKSYHSFLLQNIFFFSTYDGSKLAEFEKRKGVYKYGKNL